MASRSVDSLGQIRVLTPEFIVNCKVRDSEVTYVFPQIMIDEFVYGKGLVLPGEHLHPLHQSHLVAMVEDVRRIGVASSRMEPD
jgi:hypothetical protein